MATRIAQRELRNNNADILNRVQAGERFVVTRNGIAVADVVPHTDRNAPPMFPRTRDLTARRRTVGRPVLDRDLWLRDIRRADEAIDDDPTDSRA
ncbi:MAG: type II toxin-antitoxin system prevent-host-death family antitoxin [Jatrophihabitans sp.]|nr:MAG: type II toxin-antitoxin system prevent-host-death family antitoxin [Jatrophihabitans sp.]